MGWGPQKWNLRATLWYMLAIAWPTNKTVGTMLWKASGDIEKRQRMANGAANGVRYSMFAAPFAALFPIISSNVRYSMFTAPFAIPRAIRRSPRRSSRQSPFDGPFPVMFFPIFTIQGSIFNVRRAIRFPYNVNTNLATPFSDRLITVIFWFSHLENIWCHTSSCEVFYTKSVTPQLMQ